MRKIAMTRGCPWLVGLLVLLVGVPCPAPACTYCTGLQSTMPTWRQTTGTCKVIVYGTMVDANLREGTTVMKIERILRDDPALSNKKEVVVRKYLPQADPKVPLKYVLFFDVYNNKLDVLQGIPARSAVLVDYLKGILELDPKDSTAALRYFFRYIDHSDDAIAADAFAEFARANDAEIGHVAKYLDPAKLKKLIDDPKTPAPRFALFAFLLGACGGDAEATFLRNMIEKPEPRTLQALDGALGGYIQLRPKDGWDTVQAILKDGKRPFNQRMAALQTMRFYHGWKGKDVEPELVRGLGALIEQGDIGDLAIEDLRKWKLWSKTGDVLQLYGKETHQSPIMKRAIVRYALSVERDDSRYKEKVVSFLQERKNKEPELVKDVEEALRFEDKK